MSVKYHNNKGHQEFKLLDEDDLIRNVDSMIFAFSEPIMQHANRSKQKSRLKDDISVGPATVLRNLKALKKLFVGTIKGDELVNIFEELSPDANASGIFTTLPYNRQFRDLKEMLHKRERNEAAVFSLFSMTHEDLRLGLDKHYGVLSSNRRFIREHQKEIMDWFSSTMKQFTTVDVSEDLLCEELTEEYVLKCKKNQASASKLWGSVRVRCECAGEYRRDNKMAHCRTQRHSTWVGTLKEKRKHDDVVVELLQEAHVIGGKASKTDLVENAKPVL